MRAFRYEVQVTEASAWSLWQGDLMQEVDIAVKNESDTKPAISKIFLSCQIPEISYLPN